MRGHVRTEAITKIYTVGDQEFPALQNVTTDIHAGALTMLVGPSGCGKTTLLSIITGILSPTTGKVFIGETELTALKDKQKVLFRRQNIGFVFQQFNLLPALTSAENAAIPLLAAGVPFHKALARGREVLEEIGMDGQTEKLPGQLSGGQQQRVAFARALVHKPKVVVCDEPTSALDAKSGRQVMDVLRRIAVQPDAAVIVVTHDSRIFDFADRIIRMSDGHIIEGATSGYEDI